MTSDVKSWFGDAVLGAVAHPAVRGLAEKWLHIVAERDPLLADFWHDADQVFFDHASLLIKGESDYTYLHHGRALSSRIGFSMQGLRLSELRIQAVQPVMKIYDRCTAEFIPAYFQTFVEFQNDVMLWGRVVLPVRISTDDQRIAIFLYSHPIQDKASMFRALFERSRSGIVIAEPVKDETGRATDAWIVTLNDAARRLTGLDAYAGADARIRRSRLLARDEVWSAVVDGIAERGTVAVLSDAANGHAVNLHTELVDDYFVFRLTPVPPVNRTFLIS